MDGKMGKPDMNDRDVQNTIENNFIELCLAAARASSGKIVSEKGYSYTKDCLMAWYDRIFALREPALRSPDFFCDMKSRISKGELPRSIFLSSELVSRGIDKQFLNHGFEPFYEQTGMATHHGQKEFALTSDEEIRPIKTDDELNEWIGCLERVFGKKRSKALYERLSTHRGISLWGLYSAKIMVSTVLILTDGKTAGLHLIGTHPEFRHRGFGTKMTAFAVNRCFQEKNEAVVLLSSNMGKALYAQLGFREQGKVLHLKLSNPKTGST